MHYVRGNYLIWLGGQPDCMKEKSGLLYNLALFKQRYTRGTSWTQIFLNFGIITANAKLFEDFFLFHFGLTIPMVIAISIPVYILFCYVLGHIDEKSGFWQIENDLGYRVTPLSGEMLQTIREINRKLSDSADRQK
jgi:cellulose synthase/poly-beta-1,6-N-acetylglucosamine synthase-like glycosyltransferase